MFHKKIALSLAFAQSFTPPRQRVDAGGSALALPVPVSVSAAC
jgi:hypothetical protein